MSYLCQKCKKKMGVTDFVSEIKCVENSRNSAWSTGVCSLNIESELTEANELTELDFAFCKKFQLPVDSFVFIFSLNVENRLRKWSIKKIRHTEHAKIVFTLQHVQGPFPERRNNSIPGVKMPYFRDNFIPGIKSVPEGRNSATQGMNLG